MQVIEDAAAEYLTYFAGKVVGMIRAPDEFIYLPPFNIFETFLIAPLEYVMYSTPIRQFYQKRFTGTL